MYPQGMVPQWAGSALLAGCAELGDRTFLLSVLLAAWCPIGGVRGGHNAIIATLFVLLGTTLALTCHTLLAVSGVSLTAWGGSVHVAGAVLFAAMACRAYMEMGNRQASAPVKEKEIAESDPGFTPNPYASYLVSRRPPVGSIDDASDRQQHVASYGAAFAPSTAESPASSAWNWGPAIGAFVSTFVIILLAELGDRSQLATHEASLAPGSSWPTLVFGAAFGYLIADGLAVLIGVMIRIQLSERQVLLVSMLIVSALSIAETGQALLTFARSHSLTSLPPLGFISKAWSLRRKMVGP